MTPPDPATDALLAGALDFTRDGLRAYGYVEERPVGREIVPEALVTGRTYGIDRTHFTGAVYDGDGCLVRGSLGFAEGPYTPMDADRLPQGRRAGVRRLNAALYGGPLYYVLGHMLFETVARLWPAAEPGAERVPIVFHPWPGLDIGKVFANPLYRAIFAALGIDRSRVELAESDLVVGRLDCPDPLSVYHDYLHPRMAPLLDHLADRIVARPGLLARFRPRRASSKRIFLSRGRWQANRRIANEDELEALFGALGFAILHPQDMAPAALIEALRGALAVASTDGSQAHLAAFCRPGTATLMIDTRPVPTQFAIAKLRGLRNVHIPVCTNGQWDSGTKRVDTSVRMERLVTTALAAAWVPPAT